MFAMPLVDGGFVRGVVAHKGPRKPCMLAYYFAPRLESPSLCTFEGIRPTMFACAIRCGVRALQDERWPIVGKVPSFNRDEWPVPLIDMGVSHNGQQIVGVLDKEDLLRFVDERVARKGDWIIDGVLDDSASPEWSVAKYITKQ